MFRLLATFLHGYTRKIRDIVQLWPLTVRDSWTAGAFPCLAAGQLGLRLRAAGQLFSFDRWCIKEAAGELLVVGRQTAVGEFAKKWGQISMEGRQYKTDPSPWCSS